MSQQQELIFQKPSGRKKEKAHHPELPEQGQVQGFHLIPSVVA